MRTKRFTSHLSLVMISFLLGTYLGLGADLRADCHQRTLGAEIASVRSVVWMNNLTEIVITDPIDRQVLVLSPNGKLKRELVIGNDKPLLGFTVGSSYVQVVSGYRLLWFDSEYRPMGRMRLSGKMTDFLS